MYLLYVEAQGTLKYKWEQGYSIGGETRGGLNGWGTHTSDAYSVLQAYSRKPTERLYHTRRGGQHVETHHCVFDRSRLVVRFIVENHHTSYGVVYFLDFGEVHHTIVPLDQDRVAWFEGKIATGCRHPLSMADMKLEVVQT